MIGQAEVDYEEDKIAMKEAIPFPKKIISHLSALSPRPSP